MTQHNGYNPQPYRGRKNPPAPLGGKKDKKGCFSMIVNPVTVSVAWTLAAIGV